MKKAQTKHGCSIPLTALSEEERRLWACWQVLEEDEYLSLLVDSLRKRGAIGPKDTVFTMEFLQVALEKEAK